MSPKQHSTVLRMVNGFRRQASTLRWIVNFHHGDCVGSDYEFNHMVLGANSTVHIHPPKDQKLRAWCSGDVLYEEKAYLDRNKDIVDACSIVIATPFSDYKVGGTWYTISYALDQSKHVRVVMPNGSIQNFC